jgi:antirestriction protein
MDHLTTPKIYVADLAAYNAGHLRGQWVYLPDYADVDELMNKINCLLGEWDRDLLDGMTGPVEEYAIHDYEGLPGTLYDEYLGRAGLRRLLFYVDLLDTARSHGAAREFVEIARDRGLQSEEWADAFHQSYRGTFDSAEEWAYQYIDSTGQLDDMPDNLRYYFDYESFARDVRLGGDMDFVQDGMKTHVFDPHF